MTDNKYNFSWNKVGEYKIDYLLITAHVDVFLSSTGTLHYIKYHLADLKYIMMK